MKNNKGFTLIEMLVVIAVIGILSAATLTALGPARNKSKDSRIMRAMEQARILVETKYDGSKNAYPARIGNISGATAFGTSGFLAGTRTEIKKLNGVSDNNIAFDYRKHCVSNIRMKVFAIVARLNDGVDYCLDSSGFSGKVLGQANRDWFNNDGDCDTDGVTVDTCYSAGY